MHLHDICVLIHRQSNISSVINLFPGRFQFCVCLFAADVLVFFVLLDLFPCWGDEACCIALRCTANAVIFYHIFLLLAFSSTLSPLLLLGLSFLDIAILLAWSPCI